MIHHTGNDRESAASIKRGRPDLRGPLSQLHIDRHGIVTLVALGVAWHAGRGSYPGIPPNAANWHTLGIECAWPKIRNGHYDKAQPWPDEQIISMRDTTAALLKRLGLSHAHVIGHKDWAGASQGKWDPGNLDLRWFQGEVKLAMEGHFDEHPKAVAPEPPSEPPRLAKAPNTRTDRELLEDIWEALHGPDGNGWPQLDGLTVVDYIGEK
jgi:hypothetical protein